MADTKQMRVVPGVGLAYKPSVLGERIRKRAQLIKLGKIKKSAVPPSEKWSGIIRGPDGQIVGHIDEGPKTPPANQENVDSLVLQAQALQKEFREQAPMPPVIKQAVKTAEVLAAMMEQEDGSEVDAPGRGGAIQEDGPKAKGPRTKSARRRSVNRPAKVRSKAVRQDGGDGAQTSGEKA